MMEEAFKLENYSYDDYLEIDQSTKERLELIFGKIYMMAGASEAHQDAVGNIFFMLKTLTKNKQPCKAIVAPFDLKLIVDEKTNVVQPDVMLFCDAELPCAIFEVLSPSTAYKDKTVKKELYARSGIEEYFLINIEFNIVEKFILEDSNYQYIEVYGLDDKLPLDCMDTDITVSEIFE